MCNIDFSNDYSSLIKRIEILEEKLSQYENGTVIAKNIKSENHTKNEIKHEPAKPVVKEVEFETVQNKSEPEKKETTNTVNSGFDWKKVVERAFDIGGLQLYSAVYSAKAVLKDGTVVVSCDDAAKKQIIVNAKNELHEILKKLYGENIRLTFDDIHVTDNTDENTLFSSLNDLSNKFSKNADMN